MSEPQGMRKRANCGGLSNHRPCRHTASNTAYPSYLWRPGCGPQCQVRQSHSKVAALVELQQRKRSLAGREMDGAAQQGAGSQHGKHVVSVLAATLLCPCQLRQTGQ